MLTPEQKERFNKWVRDYQDEERNPFTITLYLRELMIAEHAWEAALPPAVPQGWQPIETAPKDGTEVLMRFIGRRPYITGVKWHQGCFVQLSDYCPVAIHEARGWMPLPAAPEYKPAQQPADDVVRDAERYRWLRSEHAINDPMASVVWKRNYDRKESVWVNTSDVRSLDSAIDTAMAKEKA